jgi:hypothetical protein
VIVTHAAQEQKSSLNSWEGLTVALKQGFIAIAQDEQKTGAASPRDSCSSITVDANAVGAK